MIKDSDGLHITSSRRWTIPWDGATGRHLGEYVLGPSLGGGGEGSVFLATTHRWPGHLFALKIIPVAPGYDPNCHAEIAALQRLDHPNIVRCYAVSVVDDQLLMLLEYCAGGVLQEELVALDGRPMHRERFIEVGRQLAEGLRYLHELGFSHGDIKPGNLLWRDEERRHLVIGDFGMAQFLRTGGLLKRRGGSDYYRPPEGFIRGIAPMDPLEADVWAFGVVLAWMAIGDPPWQGGSDEMVQRAICACCYRTPPNADEAIMGVLHATLCDREVRAKMSAIVEMPIFRVKLARPPSAPGMGLRGSAFSATLPRRKSCGSGRCGIFAEASVHVPRRVGSADGTSDPD